MSSVKELKTFQSILLLRAIAAIFILLFHITSVVQTRFNYRFLFGFFETGHYGVDLFFVLSGFLLYITYKKRFGKKEEIKRYLFRRFIRIYPAYWILCLSILLLYFFWKPLFVQGNIYDIWYFFSVFSIFPHGPEITSPVWYLKHQIFLYMFFTLFFIIKRQEIIMKLIAVYVFAIFGYLYIVHVIPFPKVIYDFTSIWFSPYVLEFIIGLFIGWLSNKYFFNLKISLYLIIYGFFLLIFFHNFFHFLLKSDYYVNSLRWVTYGVPFACIILGLVKYESQRPVWIPSVVLAIGKSSYIIYISQMVIIQSIFTKTADMISKDASKVVLNSISIITILLTIAFSFLFYTYIEKNVVNMLQKKKI